MLIMLGYAMSPYDDQLSQTAERPRQPVLTRWLRGQIKSMLKGKDSYYSKQIWYMSEEVQEELWQ